MSRDMQVSDSVVIDVDAETIWTQVADPTQMPRWSRENTGATHAGGRSPAHGRRASSTAPTSAAGPVEHRVRRDRLRAGATVRLRRPQDRAAHARSSAAGSRPGPTTSRPSTAGRGSPRPGPMAAQGWPDWLAGGVRQGRHRRQALRRLPATQHPQHARSDEDGLRERRPHRVTAPPDSCSPRAPAGGWAPRRRWSTAGCGARSRCWPRAAASGSTSCWGCGGRGETQLLDGLEVEVVVADDWADGMGASLKAGPERDRRRRAGHPRRPARRRSRRRGQGPREWSDARAGDVRRQARAPGADRRATTGKP